MFVPLGGVGEIGMNLYLYGYGPPDDREWLIVDMGITFGGDTEPGIDVILPDIPSSRRSARTSRACS